MAIFRPALVVALLAMTMEVHAICPIGEGLSTQDWPDQTSGDDHDQGSIVYQPAGEMDDGTIVLHAIQSQGSKSESHDLLLLRPATASGFQGDDNPALVRISGEDYVIERIESVAIDQPCESTVSVDGNEVVLTIVAP